MIMNIFGAAQNFKILRRNKLKYTCICIGKTSCQYEQVLHDFRDTNRGTIRSIFIQKLTDCQWRNPDVLIQ